MQQKLRFLIGVCLHAYAIIRQDAQKTLYNIVTGSDSDHMLTVDNKFVFFLIFIYLQVIVTCDASQGSSILKVRRIIRHVSDRTHTHTEKDQKDARNFECKHFSHISSTLHRKTNKIPNNAPINTTTQNFLYFRNC